MNYKHLLLYTLMSVTTYSAAQPLYAQQQKYVRNKSITEEDIWKNGTFAVKSVPGFNMMKNGTDYVKVIKEKNNTKLEIYNLQSNKKVKTLLDTDELPKEFKSLDISNYTFSADEQKIIVMTESTPIYRHSALYKTYIIDLQTKQVITLNKNKVMHPTFNPSGTKVAFVQSNNLFIYDIKSNTTKQITFDGKENAIINGNCDWVYEEEFGFTQAYQWSPKGDYLAYYKFDESKVPEFTIPFYEGKNYTRDYTYKYPKAGEANSVVNIHITNVITGKDVTVDVGTNSDQYIPRIKWTKSDTALCVYQLNRHQNDLKLLFANSNSGKTTVRYEEQNKYYIDINDNIQFLDNNWMIYTSEKDGYNHLYKYNYVTKEDIQITKGAYDIDALIGLNSDQTVAYFTAGVNSPMERQLYQVNLKKNARLEQLTKGEGTHQISSGTGNKFFVDKWSNMKMVPQFRIIDHTGKIVRNLEANESLKETMAMYNLGDVEMTTFKAADNQTDLNAYVIYPPHFSKQQKFPVLMYQYSGPGSQQVMNKFPLDNYFWHQMLAQKGYIIVVADGRGTGARGEDFKKSTYLNLGKLESDDQIAVAKQLGQLEYVDAARIGIWGWSFGGFMSSICIGKAPEVFKTAIAVAPVTNWRYYDNIYTERYMRTPQENEAGYDENSPLKYAEKIKGNYLLVHGTADDNVHYQNALEMMRILTDKNIPYDSQIYTNKNHSIVGGNARLHLYKKMTKFILNNL